MHALTSVRTATQVRTFARSVVSVANGVVEVLLTITTGRELAGGTLVESMKVVLSGIQVWLSLKQLQTVHLEVCNAAGKVIERWDLPMDYVPQPETEERYESQVDLIKGKLRALGRLPDAASYRLVVTNKPGSARVPGWSPTKLGDVSHLKCEQVTGEILSTPAIRVSAQLFRGEAT